jgi:hypothetical protein
MSLSMYEASIPLLARFLRALDRILDKAQAYADQKKFDSAVLVQARLAPDMFELARQVQIACDMAKGCAARLAGIEAPRHADDEATLAELKARIGKVLAFIEGVDPAKFEGSETRDIRLVFPSQTFDFKGRDYLFGFVWPNFHFHMTTAYDILRHNGVELAKSDYLAG